MSVRIVAAGEARRMPWKNGRGMTLELATDAPASDLAAWTWRLSIADVPERGPFSRFPGIDRWIACLAGEGLRLHRGARVDDVPRNGVGLAFAGEDEIEGETIVLHAFTAPLAIELGRSSLRLETGSTLVAGGSVRWLADPDAVAVVAEIDRRRPG